MPASPFALTPVQRAVLEAIAEEHPNLMADLRAWLAGVLDDLTLTAQGRVVTESEADELLGQLREEAVGRMSTDMEALGEDEGLRETVVELVARHYLAQARDGFVRRVIARKRS